MDRVLARWLAPHAERAYAILRIVSGVLFAFHGVQKLFGAFGRKTAAFGSQLWIGGVIELVAGIAIALGFWTRSAALLASGTMAVAYAQFHWKFRGGEHLLPIVNKGELAAVYAFLFLFVACKGAGSWSLDGRRRG